MTDTSVKTENKPVGAESYDKSPQHVSDRIANRHSQGRFRSTEFIPNAAENSYFVSYLS